MLDELFNRMFDAYGPQDWWPGESDLEIVVGAVLTQNTNWKNVELAIENLRSANLLSLDALHSAIHEELESLIRPAGYYRLKAKRLKNVIRFIVEQYGSMDAMRDASLGQLREELLGVNGVGPETADSILLYACDKPTFVVDTYTARMLKRHGWIEADADYHTIKGFFESKLTHNVAYFNEFHALVVQVDKHHCKPKAKCEGCPLEPMLPATGIVDW